MEIIIGENSGFCFGVNNAVEKTKAKLEDSTKTVYCLGEIVHNKQVTEQLENLGLKIEEDINNVPKNAECVIRAHGVAPCVYEIAKSKNIELTDLTCPKVKMVHKLVEEYKNKNYCIVIIAKKTHPETIGTKGFAGDNSFVVESEDDIQDAIEYIQTVNTKNIVIVSQTTFSVEKFNKLSKMLQEQLENFAVEIKSCICNSTDIRQKEVAKLSKEVDLMIIVGGKNSSNTEKLYKIAQKEAQNSIWVQTKEDIDKEYVKQFNKIGIMSGASTPMEIIYDIKESCQ